MTAATGPAAPVFANNRQNRPTAGKTLTRLGLYALALAITLFMLVPIYLIALSAFSTEAAIFAYPKSLLPINLSADTFLYFWNARGVQPATSPSGSMSAGVMPAIR